MSSLNQVTHFVGKKLVPPLALFLVFAKLNRFSPAEKRKFIIFSVPYFGA
jgi:hypothetical protein